MGVQLCFRLYLDTLKIQNRMKQNVLTTLFSFNKLSKTLQFRGGILKEEKTLELRVLGLNLKLPQTLINSLGL